MTRPSQLLPTGIDARKALQSFVAVMSDYTGAIDGDFGTGSKQAYNNLRDRYDFLPDIGDTLEESEIPNIMAAIDTGLQTDTTFQGEYVDAISSETSTLKLQGALSAGGSWANRHLGDRISEAEAIDMDGDRGVLTERGLRNGIYMTGVSSLQSCLNLLEDTDLTVNGHIDEPTESAMQAYAEKTGLELTGELQTDYLTVTEYIQNNEQDRLRGVVADTLNNDTDFSERDPRTVDAQNAMNYLARLNGSDIRTAPDGLQTDSRIAEPDSHTRHRIAPEVGIDLTDESPEIVVTAESDPPFGINESFEVTRKSVLDELSDIILQQQSNPESPENILAYSSETRAYMLVHKQTDGTSAVYQISDTNIQNIVPGITDGSIAIDTTAQKEIATELHGNRPETEAYSSQEIRDALQEDPQNFTHETREELMTTSAQMPDGQEIRFGLDDLHDALDKMDSKHDWQGSSDPIAIRDYVKELRQAVEDGREERDVNLPEWQGGTLDDSNSVTLEIAGQQTRVPLEVWNGIDNKMQETESGYSTGRSYSTLVEEQEADDKPNISESFADNATGAPEAEEEAEVVVEEEATPDPEETPAAPTEPDAGEQPAPPPPLPAVVAASQDKSNNHNANAKFLE